MAVSRVLPSSILKRFRFQVEPSGAKNGSNLVYTTPETFLEDSIQLYLNGVRLMRDAACDFTVSESGGAGTGFDTITMAASLPPRVDDNFFADYITDG